MRVQISTLGVARKMQHQKQECKKTEKSKFKSQTDCFVKNKTQGVAFGMFEKASQLSYETIYNILSQKYKMKNNYICSFIAKRFFDEKFSIEEINDAVNFMKRYAKLTLLSASGQEDAILIKKGFARVESQKTESQKPYRTVLKEMSNEEEFLNKSQQYDYLQSVLYTRYNDQLPNEQEVENTIFNLMELKYYTLDNLTINLQLDFFEEIGQNLYSDNSSFRNMSKISQECINAIDELNRLQPDDEGFYKSKEEVVSERLNKLINEATIKKILKEEYHIKSEDTLKYISDYFNRLEYSNLTEETKKKILKTILLYICLIFVAILTLFPLLWGISASLRDDLELYSYIKPFTIHTFFCIVWVTNYGFCIWISA